jgi:hypothetical protein
MHNATPLLRTALEPIVRRHRQLRLLGWMASAFLALGLVGMLVLPPAILLIVAAVGGAWAAWVYASNWQPDYGAVAQQIEERHPDLQHLLRTAVEQSPDAQTKKLTYLQQRVVAEAVAACQRSEIMQSVPQSRVAGAWAVLAAASALLVFALVSLPSSGATARPAAAAAKAAEAVEVTPGDVTIERGGGLVVLAKFNRDVPTEAVLVVFKGGQPPERISLVKNLGDPVFGGGITEVDASLGYRVEYAGNITRDFRVTVFEHPRLDRADAHLKFPEYTHLPEKDIPDTRRVSAVVASLLDVQFHLNKPVRRATLVEKDGTQIALAVDPAKPLAELKGFEIKVSGKYSLQLEDADGRGPKVPIYFAIEARPNRAPEVKLISPKHDLRVSPIEEIAFRGEAWDDFGLNAAGFAYSVGGTKMKEVKLSEATKADARVTLDYQLKLEELGVKPDELVSWYFWAEDIGPNGKPRRAMSDMFFAVVRPFEEIFRQGEAGESAQKKGKQSAQGQQAQQQAAEQKQVITATWNFQRTETDPAKPSEKYLKDAPVVRDAQAQVLEKTRALAEKVDNEKSRAFADQAVSAMEKSLDLLKSAATDPKPLPEAVESERAAYDALLKLAAHEFSVTKSQSQQSESQAENSQGMQQQLDQLDLKQEKQRYENQSEAETPEKEEQREQLAVLNRLKELAQRQEDINERVKEMQSALQEAKTEKEKEELKRQLQRLREEQQEQLAEIDALKEKTEEPKNQARFAEEREKLEKTRAEAQKAAEAMQKGEASQALAAGARTQRNLQEMRDDVRRKASQQFTDEMRQMRTDARQLAEKQKEVSEKLTADAAKPQRKTLDGSGDREQAAKSLGEQQKNFEKLTEDMKRVSEQAEAAEPLLAKELYDTLRKSAQANTSKTLEQTQELAQRGLAQQAQPFEEKARGEIDEVKAGVERAAERVLGNEAEALKKARAELDKLSKELDSEIARKAGEKPEEGEKAEDAQGREGQPNDAQKAGQNGPRTANNKSRNGQPGEPREGDPNGERQSGGKAAAQDPEGKDQPAGTPNERGEGKPGEPGRQPGQKPGERNGQGQPRPGQPNENGQPQGDQEGNPQGEGQPREGQPRPGEPAGNEPREGAQPNGRPGQRPGGRDPQNGERKPGEGQPGERQPGDQPKEGEGQQRGEGQQPGEGKQPGAQPGRQSQGQPGEQNPSQQAGRQPGGRQPGQKPGEQPGEGQQPGEGNQPGQPGGQPGQTAGNNPNRNPASREQGNRQPGQPQPGQREGNRRGGNNDGGGGGGPLDFENSGPITGEKFVEWSDRLRSVEEMLDEPALRTEAARIREIAKGVRSEFKRHSVEPKWDVVRSQIHRPLAELRNRVTDEIARKDNQEALVPIDRDPVPARFTEQVRKYYEDLGK